MRWEGEGGEVGRRERDRKGNKTSYDQTLIQPHLINHYPVCMYVCTYVCMYVCMYVCTYMHGDKRGMVMKEECFCLFNRCYCFVCLFVCLGLAVDSR